VIVVIVINIILPFLHSLTRLHCIVMPMPMTIPAMMSVGVRFLLVGIPLLMCIVVGLPFLFGLSVALLAVLIPLGVAVAAIVSIGTVVGGFCALAYFLYQLVCIPPLMEKRVGFESIVVGHRGCVKDGYTENTIPAIEHAIDCGCDAFEIDTQLSADDIPVVFHDFSVDRLTDGKGSVRSFTGEQLKALKVVGTKGEKIVELKDVVSLAKRRNVKFFLEIKEYNNMTKIVEEVAQVLEEYEMVHNTLIISFNPIALYKLRIINPQLQTVLLVRKNIIEIVAEAKPLPILSKSKRICAILDWILVFAATHSFLLPRLLGVCGMGFHEEMLEDESIVNKWRSMGKLINLWVPKPKHKQICFWNNCHQQAWVRD
jgi:glycerophosphoryl diester phosphodiesterase